MKDRIFLLALFFSMAVLAACATQPPPYTKGVQLFLQKDYAAASAELAPLAGRGEPTAQYYAGLMRIKGVSANPNTLDDALNLVIASARAGNDDALAMLVVLSMNDAERRAFARTTDTRPGKLKEGTTPDGTYFLQMPFNLYEHSYAFAEAAAAGPAPLVLLMKMARAIDEVNTWPPESQAVSISATALLDIDGARADRGDKYAAARLANRYKEGLGVERNLDLAFRWNMNAAKTSGPPRNCIYQAPVGDGAGSVYCYDAGAASAGVPKAKLEVCRAYAEGAGVARNTARAMRWCKRAAKHARWRAQAEAILNTLQS